MDKKDGIILVSVVLMIGIIFGGLAGFMIGKIYGIECGAEYVSTMVVETMERNTIEED